MPTFKLDGKDIPFEPGETIIRAAQKHGIEIPHYCWHPGLSVAANCRMCLVEVAPPPGQRPMMLDVLEWDATVGDYVAKKKPKLQPSCQVAVVEGMDVRSDSSEHVRKVRRDVQEMLLLDHPVDCPICDQAGECKLQDYWLEHGQFKKRMTDEVVHKPKAVVFGPTIVYDAERCIVCTRCVRFMAEVAKDPVLSKRERGDLGEITVAPGRKLEGNYTLMTEHVCPVGALTSLDFRFKARVWFLRTVKSICQGCETGCNAQLDYDPRYDKVLRYRPRENGDVNGYWMCDEGMLSHHRAHEGRVTEARIAGKKTSLEKALAAAKARLSGASKGSVGVVLSAQHSLEDNWAFRELGKVLFGATRVYVTGRASGVADGILMRADKNPNSAGVKQVEPEAKGFSELVDDIKAGSVTHVLALGGEAPATDDALRTLAALVVVAAHDGVLASAAHVLLPAASWAEASGTYVNFKGMRQLAEKAVNPAGASLPAWELAAKLATALGLDARWVRLRDVRSRLAADVPNFGPETAVP